MHRNNIVMAIPRPHEHLNQVLTVLYCTVLYCTVLYCTVLYQEAES